MFFSRNEHGLWLFGEANSLAQEAWRRECVEPPAAGRLFDDGDLFDGEEERRRRQWIAEIKKNIEQILAEHAKFALRDRHIEVMGTVMDEARKMHIRAAVKELYRECKTSCKGTGNVEDFVITPP